METTKVTTKVNLEIHLKPSKISAGVRIHSEHVMEQRQKRTGTESVVRSIHALWE